MDREIRMIMICLFFFSRVPPLSFFFFCPFFRRAEERDCWQPQTLQDKARTRKTPTTQGGQARTSIYPHLFTMSSRSPVTSSRRTQRTPPRAHKQDSDARDDGSPGKKGREDGTTSLPLLYVVEVQYTCASRCRFLSSKFAMTSSLGGQLFCEDLERQPRKSKMWKNRGYPVMT